MYRVLLSQEARKFYAKADKPLAHKLNRCFAALSRDPRGGNNIKPLRGKLAGAYRYRLGEHRVVYMIDDDRVIVSVITIAHRREVYE